MSNWVLKLNRWVGQIEIARAGWETYPTHAADATDDNLTAVRNFSIFGRFSRNIDVFKTATSSQLRAQLRRNFAGEAQALWHVGRRLARGKSEKSARQVD